MWRLESHLLWINKICNENEKSRRQVLTEDYGKLLVPKAMGADLESAPEQCL